MILQVHALIYTWSLCWILYIYKKTLSMRGDVILLISNDNTWDIASLIFFILRQRDKARDNTKNATSRKKKFSHEIVFCFLFYFSCAKYDPTNETIVSVGYFFFVVVIIPRSLSTEVIILNFGILNKKKFENKRKNCSLTDVSFLLCGFYSIVW